VGSGGNQPKAAPMKDVSAFREGVKVKHPKFGVGLIVSVRGPESNLVLNVAFDGFGIKQLSANLAPLTVIK
jgi:DNA helicase-2/ATP-dependent DNA helicase PcrA